MEKGKLVSLEDRIPKLKQQRRRKANRRLVILLSLFFSLILVIAYIQSPLSRIRTISIKGNEFYSSNELIEKTGLSTNMNIWKVKSSSISAKLEHLPEIKKASVHMKWPNTIEVTIVEYKKLAYVKNNSAYSPVLENGTILKNRTTGKFPVNAPILVGFKEGVVLDHFLGELEKLPEEVLNSISEIKYSPDKTDHDHVRLFMNDGFEVSATINSFSEKMSHYPSIIRQLDPNKKGIIDLEVGSYFKAYEPAPTEGDKVEKN